MARIHRQGVCYLRTLDGMTTVSKSNISETAFITNESRAREVHVSQDRFARLWVTEKTKKLWEEFSQKVYSFDDIELAIRNRFYLDRLRKFTASHKHPCFVNIASGFTSYPFLVESNRLRCLEIDYDHTIGFKKEQVRKWQEKELLPKKDIEFFGMDLNEIAQIEQMGKKLANWINDSPSIVFLEGVTYYLNSGALYAIVKELKEVQTANSLLLFDFWTPEIESNPVFQRLKKYFSERLGFGETKYNLLSEDEIRRFGSYRIAEITDVQKEELNYYETRRLNSFEDILPEQYACLERI